MVVLLYHEHCSLYNLNQLPMLPWLYPHIDQPHSLRLAYVICCNGLDIGQSSVEMFCTLEQYSQVCHIYCKQSFFILLLRRWLLLLTIVVETSTSASTLVTPAMTTSMMVIIPLVGVVLFLIIVFPLRMKGSLIGTSRIWRSGTKRSKIVVEEKNFMVFFQLSTF